MTRSGSQTTPRGGVEADFVVRFVDHGDCVKLWYGVVGYSVAWYGVA